MSEQQDLHCTHLRTSVRLGKRTRVSLTPQEGELLRKIVSARMEYMDGDAAEVREFTLREVLAAGLVAVARSEGVEL